MYSNHVQFGFHTPAAERRGQSLPVTGDTSNALTLLACALCLAQRAQFLFSASLAALRALNWLKIMLRVQSVASSE